MFFYIQMHFLHNAPTELQHSLDVFFLLIYRSAGATNSYDCIDNLIRALKKVLLKKFRYIYICGCGEAQKNLSVSRKVQISFCKPSSNIYAKPCGLLINKDATTFLQ